MCSGRSSATTKFDLESSDRFQASAFRLHRLRARYGENLGRCALPCSWKFTREVRPTRSTRWPST
jgi:hypothetical protein